MVVNLRKSSLSLDEEGVKWVKETIKSMTLILVNRH
jgi:hypothetical protein